MAMRKDKEVLSSNSESICVPLLYYWRRDNYRRDLDMGAGYHLNQANPLMHQIDLGDSLWAFTRTLQRFSFE